MSVEEASNWIEAAAAEKKLEKLRWLIPLLILEVQAAMPCYEGERGGVNGCIRYEIPLCLTCTSRAELAKVPA